MQERPKGGELISKACRLGMSNGFRARRECTGISENEILTLQLSGTD